MADKPYKLSDEKKLEVERKALEHGILTVAQLERREIEKALALFDRSVVKAAHATGRGRATVYRRLQQWAVEDEIREN